MPDAVKVQVLYSWARVQLEEVPMPSIGAVHPPMAWKRYHEKVAEATAFLDLPEAVSEFIGRFDKGKYPSLVAS